MDEENEESDELELQDRLRAVEYEIWRKNAPFLYGETHSRCLSLHMSPNASAPPRTEGHAAHVPVAAWASALGAMRFLINLSVTFGDV
jgi:hypothetical protein